MRGSRIPVTIRERSLSYSFLKMNKNNILYHFTKVAIGLGLISCSNDSNTPPHSDTQIETHPPPTIIAIDPSVGDEGSPVTITGTGFSRVISENTVDFNGKEAEITFASTSQISLFVPIGAMDGIVSVMVNGQKAIGPSFTIIEVPVIISPTMGSVGTIVTITGVNFSPITVENSVSFNGTPAFVNSATITSISVIVPEGVTTGPVSISTNGRIQNGPNFTVLTEAPVSETPENFKIAFIGDATIGPDADAVLNLIKNEGAQVVIHPGDLDYIDNPQAFEDNINGILGANFPYFYSVGNHDDSNWEGPNGHQSFLEARFNRLGISWTGQLGVLSSFTYKGIFFVSSAPDEFGINSTVAGNHIRDQLANNNADWKISFWHKNQRLMQIGGKNDEAGWNVYEESRKGGALMATGHEHSYSRTYEMSNFQSQTISNTSDTVTLQKDNPATANSDEGRSFAFVSGLGGRSIRDAESGLDNNPWWADVYHSDNGGQFGALFGEFNYHGDATMARFYFKDIDGAVRDEFFVRSNN